MRRKCGSRKGYEISGLVLRACFKTRLWGGTGHWPVPAGYQPASYFGGKLPPQTDWWPTSPIFKTRLKGRLPDFLSPNGAASSSPGLPAPRGLPWVVALGLFPTPTGLRHACGSLSCNHVTTDFDHIPQSTVVLTPRASLGWMIQSSLHCVTVQTIPRVFPSPTAQFA